jgi:hypothetical protein
LAWRRGRPSFDLPIDTVLAHKVLHVMIERLFERQPWLDHAFSPSKLCSEGRSYQCPVSHAFEVPESWWSGGSDWLLEEIPN